MNFNIISQIQNTETIARGSSVRDIKRLRRQYGKGNWRKLKGFATIEFENGLIWSNVEIHWYEAQGIGKKEIKIKF